MEAHQQWYQEFCSLLTSKPPSAGGTANSKKALSSSQSNDILEQFNNDAWGTFAVLKIDFELYIKPLLSSIYYNEIQFRNDGVHLLSHNNEIYEKLMANQHNSSNNRLIHHGIDGKFINGANTRNNLSFDKKFFVLAKGLNAMEKNDKKFGKYYNVLEEYFFKESKELKESKTLKTKKKSKEKEKEKEKETNEIKKALFPSWIGIDTQVPLFKEWIGRVFNQKTSVRDSNVKPYLKSLLIISLLMICMMPLSSNENENNDKIKMLVDRYLKDKEISPKKALSLRQKLESFLVIVWDYGINAICSPNQSNKHSETYYIGQFLYWTPLCMDFVSNIECREFGDNLLTLSAAQGMLYYCKLLVRHGFDPNIAMSFVNDKWSDVSPVIKAYLESQRGHNKKGKGKGKGKGGDQSIHLSEIEASYFRLKTQLSFSTWFLAYLGCDMENKNDIYGMQHKALINDWGMPHKGLFMDDLYYDFSKFTAMQSRRVFNNNNNNNKNDSGSSNSPYVFMTHFVENVIGLLNDKIVICDAVLIVCFEYCRKFDRKLHNQLVEALKNACKDCLDSSVKSDTKERDYHWFKKFILKSNVWLLDTVNEDEKNGDGDDDEVSLIPRLQSLLRPDPSGRTIIDPTMDYSDDEGDDENDDENDHLLKLGILFDYIEDIVQNALQIQKKFIFDNIIEERKQDLENWNNLLNFTLVEDEKDKEKDKDEEKKTDVKDSDDSDADVSNGHPNENVSSLRQDRIKNGIFSDYTEMDLFQIAPLINDQNFDCFEGKSTVVQKIVL